MTSELTALEQSVRTNMAAASASSLTAAAQQLRELRTRVADLDCDLGDGLSAGWSDWDAAAQFGLFMSEMTDEETSAVLADAEYPRLRVAAAGRPYMVIQARESILTYLVSVTLAANPAAKLAKEIEQVDEEARHRREVAGGECCCHQFGDEEDADGEYDELAALAQSVDRSAVDGSYVDPDGPEVCLGRQKHIN